MADYSHAPQNNAGLLQQADEGQAARDAFDDVGEHAGSKTRFTANGPIPAVDTAAFGPGGISASDRAYGNDLHLGGGPQAQLGGVKSAGPMHAPPEKLSDADQVVDTNITAAQNEVEELLAVATKDKDKVDVKMIESKLARATLYLDEAAATMGESTAKGGRIEAALASLMEYEAKLQNLLHLGALNPGPHQAQYEALRQEPMQHFLHSEGVLMRRFGIPAAAAPVPTIGRGKDGGAPEVAALEASLRLAEIHAKEGFKQLADSKDVKQRDSIVKGTTNEIYGHLNHAFLMTALLDPQQKEAIKPALEAVSANVLLMKRWMDGREGNKQMIDTFARVLGSLNGARGNVGLDAVEKAEVKGFPEGEEAEEANERHDMEAAVNKCTDAWNTLSRTMETGVDDWFDLASKAKEHKPGFVDKLLEGLVDGVVGVIGGGIAKRMFEFAAEEVKEQLTEITTEVAKAGLKEIAAPALEAGKQEGGKEPDLKALHAVRGSMKAVCRGMQTEHVSALNKQVAAGELSIAKVNELEAATRGAEKSANADLKFRSATEWSKYMAQAGVRDTATGNTGVTPDGATDMSKYYGTYHPAEPREAPYRANNHERTAGVLRVKVLNYEPGITGHSDVLSIDSIDVNGMNDDMKDLLLSDESIKTLGDVKVPKEISVVYKVPLQRMTVAHPTLKFAVDEKGRVRDSMTVQDHDTDPPGDTSIWEKVRNLPISKSEAK